MNEKQIAKVLVQKLLDMGFTVHRYNAVTTNSIYLKLIMEYVVELELLIIMEKRNIIIDLML